MSWPGVLLLGAGIWLTVALVRMLFFTIRVAGYSMQPNLIAVIGNQRVTELGANEQLMKSNGQYAKLYNLQA